MSEQKDTGSPTEVRTTSQGSALSRRSFLKYAGASAAAAATFGLVGCDDDDNGMTPPVDGAVNLGSGDIGVLNFAYALEQLEAAFYIQVMDTPYDGMDSDTDGKILEDIMNHEIAHRDWFKAVITSKAPDSIIPGLTPKFDLDFSSKSEVLATAKALEDTGVGAYNGAGKFIQTGDYLVEAGKIVSVEARHAAAIRDLINPGSADFAGDDVIDDNGLDLALSVSAVLDAAGPFIEEDLDASNVGQ